LPNSKQDKKVKTKFEGSMQWRQGVTKKDVR